MARLVALVWALWLAGCAGSSSHARLPSTGSAADFAFTVHVYRHEIGNQILHVTGDGSVVEQWTGRAPPQYTDIVVLRREYRLQSTELAELRERLEGFFDLDDRYEDTAGRDQPAYRFYLTSRSVQKTVISADVLPSKLAALQTFADGVRRQHEGDPTRVVKNDEASAFERSVAPNPTACSTPCAR